MANISEKSREARLIWGTVILACRKLYLHWPKFLDIENMKDTGVQKEKHQTEERGIGDSVNRPAIVREIPHFGLFPAFLRERLTSHNSGFISK